MYARVFTSLFDGSMRGHPDLILVFVYLLCHADQDGTVDVHWNDIAVRTGLRAAKVRAALLALEGPDKLSRIKTDDGKRIKRIAADKDWGWTIINFKKYKEIRSQSERRVYQRDLMRRVREKDSVSTPLAPVSTPLAPVSTPLAMLANVDVDTDTDTLPQTPKGGLAGEEGDFFQALIGAESKFGENTLRLFKDQTPEGLLQAVRGWPGWQAHWREVVTEVENLNEPRIGNKLAWLTHALGRVCGLKNKTGAGRAESCVPDASDEAVRRQFDSSRGPS